MQVISEPHYRTFEGLRTLIYKEWHYYQHNFSQKCLVFWEPKPTLTTMQDTAKEEGFMASVASFFGSSKPDKTSSTTFGHDRRIEPMFFLFLDALQQLIKMNPLAFEYSHSFVLFLATEVHRNRFWEFIQSEQQQHGKALPSVFAKDLRRGHLNSVYESHNRVPLQYAHTYVEFWFDFFVGKFRKGVENPFPK